MLQYSSVVKSIHEYKSLFTPPVSAHMGVLDYIDANYILLDGSTYTDKSSLSKRRSGKMSNARIKEEYLNGDVPKKLIAKYKRSTGLCGKFSKDEKIAIINKLQKVVKKADIDSDSSFVLDYFAKDDTFAEFFAACLILSITQEPLTGFFKNIGGIGFDIRKRTNPLVSLTPDLVFVDDTIGRENIISTIAYRLYANDRLIQLTGMGGIGKSEVLRGVFNYLHQHKDEHCFDYIGFFNYTGDLSSMLAQQMYHPNFSSDDLSIEFIKKLSRQYKVLLLIDDVRHEMPDKGQLLTLDSSFIELISSNISILFSSRALLHNSFKQFPVRALSTEDCIKIFLRERNLNLYENIDDIVINPSTPELNEAEKGLLSSIIEKRAGYNTLVIARLGAMARNYEWTVFQLNRELIRRNFNIRRGLLNAAGDKIDERTLQHEINKLYDMSEIKIPAQENILEGFAKLASAPLDMNTSAQWFYEDAGVDESECRALIKDLSRRTWLQEIVINIKDDTIGYTTHSIVKSAIHSQVEILDENHTNLMQQAWGEAELLVRAQDVVEWQDTMKCRRGDRVRFRIHFLNTGKEIMRNVTIRVIVPTGMTFEPGSVILYNGSHPDGVALGDNLFADSAINIGDYASGGGTYVYFWAKVDEVNDDKNICYRVLLETNGGYVTKADTVNILVYAGQ